MLIKIIFGDRGMSKLEKFLRLKNFIKYNGLEYVKTNVSVIYDGDKIGLDISNRFSTVFYNCTEKFFPFDFLKIPECEYTNVDLMGDEGNFKISNLRGFPESAKNLRLNILDTGIESLEGCPSQLEFLTVKHCYNLVNLDFLPDYVGENLVLEDLPLVDHFPKIKVGNFVELKNLKNIRSLDGIYFEENNNDVGISLRDMRNLDFSYFPNCKNVYINDCTFSNIEGLKNCQTICHNSCVFKSLDEFRQHLIERKKWLKEDSGWIE